MTTTQAELIAKMQTGIPGVYPRPTHPPTRTGDMTAPREDCDLCDGTGWAYTSYERFMICACTLPRKDTYRTWGGE